MTVEIPVGTLLWLALALQAAATAGLRLVTVRADQALVYSLVCVRMWLSAPSGKSFLDGSVSVLLGSWILARFPSPLELVIASLWNICEAASVSLGVHHLFALLILLHPSAFILF